MTPHEEKAECSLGAHSDEIVHVHAGILGMVVNSGINVKSKLPTYDWMGRDGLPIGHKVLLRGGRQAEPVEGSRRTGIDHPRPLP